MSEKKLLEEIKPGAKAESGYGWAVFRRNAKLEKGYIVWWPLVFTTRNNRREAIAAYDALYSEPGAFRRDSKKGDVRAMVAEVRTYDVE